MSRRIALLALAAAVPYLAAVVYAPAAACGDDAAPRDREALVELGRRLFFDPAIGRQGRIGCAACHDPEHGFSDARVLSRDENGLLPRHSQPLVDLGGEAFHWDGEFDTVRDVIDARILPGLLPAKATTIRTLRRLERASAAGIADAASVAAMVESLGRFSAYYGSATDSPRVVTTIAERLAGDGRYGPGFLAAFDSMTVTPERIGDALEAYLRSLKSTDSPFDAFLAGDTDALSPEALRGYETFRGKAGCAQCHTVAGPRPSFTDGKFHNTGVAVRHAKRAFSARSDPARSAMTFIDADRGRFKTPSLRDVARRAPWFHDGSARSLEEIVRYYAAGCTTNDHLDARLRPLDLSDADVADVVGFLGSLTGAERPGLGPLAPGRSPKLTVHAEDTMGRPASGVPVVVRPFGDRLAGTKSMPAILSATTDADGCAVVDMPRSTHVLVEAPGACAAPPLPDWTSSVRIVVTPKDEVSVIVRFPEGVRTSPAKLTAAPPSGCSPSEHAVEFVKARDLAPPTALYTTAARADRRGSSACELGIEGLGTQGPNVSIDFTPGAANRIELYLAAPKGTSAASEAIGRDVEAIRRLAEALPKAR